MAAPKNNQNAKGNKGGGRYSAYKELARAELLKEMFFEPINKKIIMSKMKSGNYSLQDVFMLKALDGDMRAMVAIFNKLFPEFDRLSVRESLIKPLPDPLDDAELERLMKVFGNNDKNQEIG